MQNTAIHAGDPEIPPGVPPEAPPEVPAYPNGRADAARGGKFIA